jgi:hypothetical protein
MGGTLLVVAGGPSDCGTNPSELGWLGQTTKNYVDPLAKKSIYASKGLTVSTPVEVDPPDYEELSQEDSGISPVVIAGGVATILVVAALWSKRKS